MVVEKFFSFLVAAQALIVEPAYRAGASNFLVRDKKVTKEARLRRCPAELTSLLRRFVQTAAGDVKDIHAVRDACARTGWAWGGAG